MKEKKISIILPVLNEAECLSSCLQTLQMYRRRGHEVIVVDGGSEDGSIDIALPLVDRLLHSKPGRALQMNKGAQMASGDLLVFLHADTKLPENGQRVLELIAHTDKCWGRFDVCLSASSLIYKVIGFCMNVRSRLSGIATGDQAIFVSRTLFQEVGGFPEIALMEDIAISLTLKKKVTPICVRGKVITSARRWERNGVLKTIIKMWSLRWRYMWGSDVEVLANEYDS